MRFRDKLYLIELKKKKQNVVVVIDDQSHL